jgi:hypothetical protein
MPAQIIALNFTQPLNVSCQVGDTAYYVTTEEDGGFKKNAATVVEIGQIREISAGQSNAPIVYCLTSLPDSLDDDEVFILFSKDNKANLSSILGYYAEVKMVNDSTSAAELFSVGVDAFSSSK